MVAMVCLLNNILSLAQYLGNNLTNEFLADNNMKTLKIVHMDIFSRIFSL